MTEKRKVVLRDGSPAVVRPISQADQSAFVEGFEELSEESRFSRFFYTKNILSQREIEKLSNPDGHDHIAYGVAALDEQEREIPIAVGHCFRNPTETDLAEISIVTSDLWQGNGAGSELVRSLAAAALKAGIHRIYAVMLADNHAMRRILSKIGKTTIEDSAGRGTIEVICEIDEAQLA